MCVYSSLLLGALLVHGVQVFDDVVLLGCKLYRRTCLEESTLRQLAIGRHLLELEQDFLVLAHVGEHQVHAAHRLNLILELQAALHLGLVRLQLSLWLLHQQLLDVFGDFGVSCSSELSWAALLQDIVKHRGDLLGQEWE